MLLLAVELSSPTGTSVEGVFRLNEGFGIPTEPIVLEPGQSLEGELLLNDRFPSLPEAVKRNDVILFWSYQAPTRIYRDSERVGGMIVIPKGSSGE